MNAASWHESRYCFSSSSVRARPQQVEVGRVGDVAERAQLGAEPHVAPLDARGRLDDDGDELGLRVGAHAADHLVAVHARHHHVGDDEVGLVEFDRREARDAVHRRVHLVALVLQREGQQQPFVGLVVDDEHAEFGHHKLKNSPCTPRVFVLLCPLIQGTVT